MVVMLLCVLLLRCGLRGGVLAPLLAAAAAVWLPPAAKEGQGDCDFRLRTVRLRAQCSVRLQSSRTPVALRATYAGPPWLLCSPLCTAAAPLRGWRRRGLAATRQARGRLGALRRISAVALEAAGGWPLRGRRGDDVGFVAARHSCPGRAREGPQALSCFNRTRRRVRRVRGNFFVGELAPRRRNCFLAVSAPGNPKDFSGNCVGVAVAGELAPPPPFIGYIVIAPRRKASTAIIIRNRVISAIRALSSLRNAPHPFTGIWAAPAAASPCCASPVL